MNEIELELNKARAKTEKMMHENSVLRETVHAAVNELCNQCGRCRDEYLGACDHCKWKPVRYGELPV